MLSLNENRTTCQPENSVIRPNLFVIGAMKSGSTTLHEYLRLHPKIFMSEEKEPGYFVPELWADRPESDYHSLFAEAKTEKYVGESSTHYTKLPRYEGVVNRIAAQASSPRFLYIMRHPIERTISHYFHSVRDVRRSGETRDIISALTREEIYTAYSDYARQIEPYVSRFGKASVLTIVFEEFKADPISSLADICNWLGVEPFDFELPEIAANRAPPNYEMAAGKGILNRLRNSKIWEMFAPLVPKWIRKKAAAASVETSARSISELERAEVYDLLRDTMQESIGRLTTITGRRYDVWRLDLPRDGQGSS